MPGKTKQQSAGSTDDHLDQLLNSSEEGGDGDDGGQTGEDGNTGEQDDNDLTAGGQPGEGEEDGGTGDDGELSDRDQQVLDQMQQRFDDYAQRAIDRGIQAAMKRLGKPGQKQQSNEQGDQQQKSPSGPDAGAEREARIAYREYLGDHHKTFVDASERELANTLGSSLMRQSLAEGGDPDRAAQDAAKSVSATLKSLARAHERNTVARLKKRGALSQDSNRGGSSPAPGTAPSPARLDDKRQAATSLADQFNAQNGHQAG